MFPTLAIRTPWAVTPKPLRVRQIEARLSLRDRNRGCPTRGPLRLPEIESNQLREARLASWHACTSATEATAHRVPADVQLSKLVNSPKGVSSRQQRRTRPEASGLGEGETAIPDLKDRACAAQNTRSAPAASLIWPNGRCRIWPNGRCRTNGKSVSCTW